MQHSISFCCGYVRMLRFSVNTELFVIILSLFLACGLISQWNSVNFAYFWFQNEFRRRFCLCSVWTTKFSAWISWEKTSVLMCVQSDSLQNWNFYLCETLLLFSPKHCFYVQTCMSWKVVVLISRHIQPFLTWSSLIYLLVMKFNNFLVIKAAASGRCNILCKNSVCCK